MLCIIIYHYHYRNFVFLKCWNEPTNQPTNQPTKQTNKGHWISWMGLDFKVLYVLALKWFYSLNVWNSSIGVIGNHKVVTTKNLVFQHLPITEPTMIPYPRPLLIAIFKHGTEKENLHTKKCDCTKNVARKTQNVSWKRQFSQENQNKILEEKNKARQKKHRPK